MKNKLEKFNYIVTGASGFSGNEVYQFLKKKGFVFGVSGKKKKKFLINERLDVSTNKIRKKIKNYKINTIIHAAAYHKLNDFKKNPRLKLKKNELMVKNLISLCKKENIKNFIFFSTIDISYKDIHNRKKFYNIGKFNSEIFLKKEFKKGTLNKLIILRLPAIIGKNCNENFIHLLCKKLKTNKRIDIWNQNQKYNNLIHIRDISLIINKFLNENFKGEKIVNCLASQPLKLIDIVKFIKKKLNSKSKINICKKNFVKRKNFYFREIYKFMTVKKSIEIYLKEV